MERPVTEALHAFHPMTASGFRFIDLPTAAERLGITRTELLQWVDEGRIRPFSGKGQQSVFRTGDVEKLASELVAQNQLKVDAVAAAEEAAAAVVGAESPTRAKRRDAIKLVGTRLSQTSRWAEITDQDIATWFDALEAVQYDRVRKVVDLAMDRLQKVRQAIDQRS